MKYIMKKSWVHCDYCGYLPIFYRGFYSVGQLCKVCHFGKYKEYVYEEREIEA